MVYWIVLTLVLVCWGCWMYRQRYEYHMGVFFSLATLLFAIIIWLSLSVITCAIVTSTADLDYVKVDEDKIISLQDNNILNKTFFVGINNGMKYVYMTEENGEMSMKERGIERVNLIYSNESPKVEKYNPKFSKKIIRLLFGEINLSTSTYKIYIPEGTVKQEYNVDLQ